MCFHGDGYFFQMIVLIILARMVVPALIQRTRIHVLVSSHGKGKTVPGLSYGAISTIFSCDGPSRMILRDGFFRRCRLKPLEPNVRK